MKKILALVACLSLVASLAVGGSIAYLKEQVEHVNVMTLGNVDIEQYEQEYVLDAEGNKTDALQDYTPNKPLYPAYVNPNDESQMTGAIDKIVSVKNVGNADAYVRTMFAFEAGNLEYGEFRKNIHPVFAQNVVEDSNLKWIKENPINIDGVNYYVACVDFGMMQADQVGNSLEKVYMDSNATNEIVKQFGSTYDIAVVSQAVQTTNMPGAAEAWAVSFGEFNHTNATMWFDGLSALPSASVANSEELKNALNELSENGEGGTIVLTGDITLNVDDTITIGKNITNTIKTKAAAPADVAKSVHLDLGGHTLTATSSKTGANFNLFDVKDGATLTVSNGTIDYAHTGENMGWGNSTNIFNVTAGGVLNLNNVTAVNAGGSDMGYVVHLNNWGEVTLNVKNSTLKSNYVAVRVFNSGNDMNNVSIYDSTLMGDNSYAFWVHNYTADDFKVNEVPNQEKAEAQKALLNLDIKNGTNKFYGAKGAIRLGMTNSTVDPDVQAVQDTRKLVATAQELLNIAKNPSKYGGETIALIEDINLAGIEWEPIRIFTPETPFTFDGQGHTISNMTVTSGADKGLFDNATGTIKNVVIENANMKTSGRSAFVAGRHYGNIEDCYVKNSVLEDSYWAVGGIAGLHNSGNIKNCTIENVTVKSNGGTGGIVGLINETKGERKVENCHVKNSTIHNTGIYGEGYSAGGIVGIVNGSAIDAQITNCTVDNATKLEGKYIDKITYEPKTRSNMIVGDPV